MQSRESRMALAVPKLTAIAFTWASLDVGSFMGVKALASTHVDATATPVPFLPLPLLLHFLAGATAPLLIVTKLAKPK